MDSDRPLSAITAFVAPAAGETFWYLSNSVSKLLFEALLRLFAKEVGAGKDHIVILVLDNAGWHTEAGLRIPPGLRLVYLPPYTPELQLAETLWVHVDEPSPISTTPSLSNAANWKKGHRPHQQNQATPKVDPDTGEILTP